MPIPIDRESSRTRRVRALKALQSLLVLLVLLFGAAQAQAQSIIKQPGNHPNYTVEIEPHGLVGLLGFYGAGFGAGARFSFPIVQNGFVPKINNSVAIGVGGDFIHYTGCYYGNAGCGLSALFFPVVMQWNFFLTRDWSVMGEPGLALYHFFYDDVCRGSLGCSVNRSTWVTPVLNLGARYHFSDSAALTFRVGYPSLSVGVSFW